MKLGIDTAFNRVNETGRITVKSINDYIERRLAAEAVRRGRAAS